MRSLTETWTDSGRLAWILALVTALSLAALVPGRAPITQVWGDEGTFLAMMQSLADDGDLRFDERDAARAAVADGGRGHLILQQASSDDDSAPSFAYSKPVFFPLLAAPFYAVAGELGPIGLNLLALGLALWLARAFLHALARRDGESTGVADLTLVSFACAGVAIPYAFWRMADSLQFSLALLGLVLVFAARLPSTAHLDGVSGSSLSWRVLAWRGAPWLGTVLLAVLVSMRVSNGLLALVPLGLALVDRRWRRAAALLAVAAVSVLALQALTAGLTGADNPYRAVRATFTPDTGYPVGHDAEEVLSRFQEHRASHFTRIDRPVVSAQVLYSSLYVWIGRHTGLVFYFPASLLLLWLAVRRSDLAGKVALAAFLGTLAFYVGWKPGNYYGGETFLGNRYLLPALPALLVALRRVPPAKSWFGVWLLTALVIGSAAVSSVRCAEIGPAGEGNSASGVDSCRGSQNHAYAGLFRLLPWESTSRGIEGVRDRYWAGEFVRFVDPWARVEANTFELAAGRPSAELSVAHWRQAQIQMLRVRSSADRATLVVEQRGNLQRFEIGREIAAKRKGAKAAPGADWLAVDVRPKRSWRHHRFWFNESPYWIGSYRLHVESPDPDASAEIIFVGDPVTLSRAFSYELLGDSWPERPLRVTLRNTSPMPWERDDPVRVTLRWRLLRPAGGGHPRHRLAEGPPLALPHTVGSGEEITLEVPVDWPTDPGAYEVEVDLVLEQVAWFSEVLGSPLLLRTFEVPAEQPEPPNSPSAD